MESRATHIPNYIKAKSEQGLRKLMLQTNLKTRMEYRYFDIQFTNGYWFAWFYQDIDLNKLFEDKLTKGE